MHIFRRTYVKIRLFKIQKYIFQKYDVFEKYEYVFPKRLAKGQICSYLVWTNTVFIKNYGQLVKKFWLQLLGIRPYCNVM